MNSEIFKYLKKYSTNPIDVDRLIVSSFLIKNNLVNTQNSFINSYLIDEVNEEDYTILENFIEVLDKKIVAFDIEHLIELFEFVISPADRIINGAIYTPSDIREYIVNNTLSKKIRVIGNTKIADISCGCGGFLFNAAKYIKSNTRKTYYQIFRDNIFGLDIQSYSTNRTKILLSLLAISDGEDIEEFQFNLFDGDALSFEWNSRIENYNGFDFILGNPPYVRLKNLNEETKLLLKNWEVCKTGLTDLYIPFFQIGIDNLAPNGILGFITMNSFFKSLNGRSLRDYFTEKSLKFRIIDFGSDQIFKSKNTYTCICLIENRRQNFIEYSESLNCNLNEAKTFDRIYYRNLNSKKGWNLKDHERITRIENIGTPFNELYKTRHGIATLKNDIYIFSPVDEDDNYYYLQNGSLYPIEKGICREIVNSNKLSRENTLDAIREKVIFPYNDDQKPVLFEEEYIKENFPEAFKYLTNKRKILAGRDKGKGEYENWYAFGRTQSLEKMPNKLFFPKISDTNPSCIINDDENLLFYNGLAVIGDDERQLIIIKKLIESNLFWYYIQRSSKPYSSSYFSLNGNYINNFGVYNFNEEETNFILNENNKDILDAFFEERYDIKL